MPSCRQTGWRVVKKGRLKNRRQRSIKKRVSKNAELRAKYEADPTKFIQSEADLDAEIKKLSILTDHPDLYAEFARIGCAGTLVSLLAHENSDIAIDAVEILQELTDDDVPAEESNWGALVDACLEADLLGLLTSNLERLNEEEEADRDGVKAVERGEDVATVLR